MTNQITTANIRDKIWLVMFFTISLNIILDAGFDNDKDSVSDTKL